MERIHIHTGNTVSDLEAVLSTERTRLVRLCGQLTNDPDIAEDLAQETLVVAWRQAHTLQDPAKRTQWLTGIARNLCRQWLRQSRRDLHDLAQPNGDSSSLDPISLVADPFDIETGLEWSELVTLLDRALALLSPDTRASLIERYIHESSHADIAAQLGLSEGAVAKRLERGKLALQRILSTQLRQEASAYGLVRSENNEWQPTQIWCPRCGQHRLEVRIDQADGGNAFHCPDCNKYSDNFHMVMMSFATPELTQNIKSFKVLFSRQARMCHAIFEQARTRQTATCPQCGQPMQVHMHLPDHMLAQLGSVQGMHMTCTVCSASITNSLQGQVLFLPATQRFWRENGRIQVLPTRELEFSGRSALLTSYTSLSGSAQLDVITARDTFEVLAVHRNPASQG